MAGIALRGVTHEAPIHPSTHPVVGLPARLELQRADGVVDVLKRVDDAVRVVVRGVNHPLVSGVRVRHVLDAVGHLPATPTTAVRDDSQPNSCPTLCLAQAALGGSVYLHAPALPGPTC